MAFVNPTRLGANPTPRRRPRLVYLPGKTRVSPHRRASRRLLSFRRPRSHRSVLLLLSSLSLLLLHSSPLSSRTRRTTPPRSACRTRTRRLFLDPRVETPRPKSGFYCSCPVLPRRPPLRGKKFRRIFSRSRRTPSRRRPTWRRPRDLLLLLLLLLRRKRASRRRPRTSFLATGPSRFVVFVVVFFRSKCAIIKSRRIIF